MNLNEKIWSLEHIDSYKRRDYRSIINGSYCYETFIHIYIKYTHVTIPENYVCCCWFNHPLYPSHGYSLKEIISFKEATRIYKLLELY